MLNVLTAQSSMTARPQDVPDGGVESVAEAACEADTAQNPQRVIEEGREGR